MGYVQGDYTLQEAQEQVGKGWHGLLYELYMLRQFYPSVKVAQVKEKFGDLRFYVDGATEEWYNKATPIIDRSMNTCEECGRPGKIRPTGWVMTLCSRHYLRMLLFNKYVRRNKVRQIKSTLRRRQNANSRNSQRR